MRWLVVATVLCVAAGALLIALSSSDLVIFLGIALGGVAFVLVLSIVFYAIGRSEDRERAERDERAAGP
jgi:ABC-type transport system involved in cytochrome bd biosynthesis fused ATPase/permease subunit